VNVAIKEGYSGGDPASVPHISGGILTGECSLKKLP